MRTILVGTDTSDSADLAVRAAVALAETTDAELLVLNVRDRSASHDAADPRKAADPERYLAEMGPRFPRVRLRTRVEPGDPAERICAVAAEERAETIVVGSRGLHGPPWRSHRSVPGRVVRCSPCSVLVVDTRAAW